MKRIVPILFFLLQMIFCRLALAQKDLPNPPSDTILIPAGSFVIPMDTIYQNMVPAGQAPFNLKAYGLINQFLKKQIPVRWAIRSGKNLNDIDFSAMAVKVFPDTNNTPVMMDFRGGPFIVVDTSTCSASTTSIIQNFGDSVAVYRLTQNVVVDIRYKIVHQPKVAIFINGGNQLIHSKILDEAGITDYDFIDAANIGSLVNCYTFVSEPHWDSSLANPAVIVGVKNFVMSGGNFLAQCQAVETYENFGFFMTTTGISLTNIPVTHSYQNADLAALQIHGNIFENQGGSVSNWTLSAGSAWNASTYKLVTNLGTDTVVAIGTHLTAPLDTGGNAFFIGCHDYMKNGVNQFDLSNISKVNELRMYLNAVFIPSIDNNLWADAGADQTTSCNSNISLGCTSTGPPGSTFSWSPSAGLSCTNCPNPVANPAVTTNYVLTVVNASGCSVMDDVNINIVPPIVANFFAQPVCIVNTTSFTDQSTGTITQWNWDFGDGSTSTQQSPSHTYAIPGNYPVTLVCSNNYGCVNSIQQNILVNPVPVASFSSNNACIGDQTCFNDLSSISMGTISSWSWDFGDPASGTADTSSQQNPCHLYNAIANPVVTLSLVSIGGCQSSITLPVSFTQLPVADFKSDTICLQSSTGFTDLSTAINSGAISNWSWDFGDGSSVSNQQNPSHLYSTIGLKNVTLIITTAAGCKDTVNQQVTVHDNPVADFSNPVSGCAPLCATFNDMSVAPDGIPSSWQWSFPGGNPSSSTTMNPSVCYSNPGNFDVSLVVTSDFGCSSSLLNSQYVNVHALPGAEFCTSPSVANLFQPTFYFCRQWSPDVVKWYWDFGDNTPVDSVNTNPAHSYSSGNNNSYSYTVWLYVENQFGCRDSMKHFVELAPEYSFYMPNSFTPNGDYLNKLFFAKGRGIKEYDISIYDRWGEKIWKCHSEGLNTDWDGDYQDGMPSSCKWDGSYNGKVVQEDVYVWRVVFKTIFDKEFNLVGSVSVVK